MIMKNGGAAEPKSITLSKNTDVEMNLIEPRLPSKYFVTTAQNKNIVVT